MWSVGTDNVIVEGALMSFQSDHDLTTTGAMDTLTWHALVGAAIQKRFDPTNYSYVDVNKNLPETATLYINGKVIFQTDVNTGITAAPTGNGTFPVYSRFTTTTMSGTLPDGQTYRDTGIPWVSYFHGGDALHGFLRSQYGYPQSLGCVEMTYARRHSLGPHPHRNPGYGPVVFEGRSAFSSCLPPPWVSSLSSPCAGNWRAPTRKRDRPNMVGLWTFITLVVPE